jgi:hypothetical protein
MGQQYTTTNNDTKAQNLHANIKSKQISTFTTTGLLRGAIPTIPSH